MVEPVAAMLVPNEPETERARVARDRAEVRRGLVVLALGLAPALLATWLVPTFVTQDGPAHVYNAHVIARSLGPDSPFRGVYEVHWSALPNWAGHLGLVGLLAVLSPRDADRVMMSVTLLGFAGAMVWLRLRVAGPRGLAATALLASLLAMNLTWLFGFYSFLLGCTLFASTLGWWWGRRDRVGPGLAAGVAVWLVLGYFCHPISLGLTVLALVVLGLATPGPGVRARLGWTALGMVPLVPLGIYYRSAMDRGGALRPIWENLKDAGSVGSWVEQFGWVDPITLGSKSALPFVPGRSNLLWLLTPLAWMMLGLLAMGLASRGQGGTSRGLRRGWAILAAGLIVGGVAAPDTLGPTHGFFLAQRVALLGLVCVVPLLGGAGGGERAKSKEQRAEGERRRANGKGRSGGCGLEDETTAGLNASLGLADETTATQVLRPHGSDGTGKGEKPEAEGRARRAWLARFGTFALALATAVQGAWVVEYALYSDRVVGPVARADRLVGRGARLAAVWLTLRGPYRANPLLHAEALLGVDTGRVIWSNYETAHYYFPVQVRPGVPHPSPRVLEEISIRDSPADADRRASAWRGLLEAHTGRIDALIVRGRDPRLDAITAEWFELTHDEPADGLRVWTRRAGPNPVASAIVTRNGGDGP